MPPSPVQLIALDEHGREVGRESEPLFIPAPPGQLPPMPRLTKRPTDPKATGKPVVLATGRAPDGAGYEFYVERFEEPDGKVYGRCITFWWPRAGAPGSGFCGPDLPPPGAFGRRHPERVFAKPFGFLDEARPVTRYLMLSGYARANVSRVRVGFADSEGVRRDAQVRLTRVDAALSERMAANGPFGFFVAFVPREARHRPIEVFAYDASGRELSRFEHRDPLLDRR